MVRPLVGIALHPDRAYLAHNRALIEDDAEVFEVMPEALWEEDTAPASGWHLFRAIRARSGRPFVAHGTLFSIGAVPAPARRARWLDALRRDHDAFAFLWFSDHLGFADAAEKHVALPLPLPPTPAAAEVCAGALAALRDVFPLVAFENNVGYFALGDPLDEPAWLNEVGARAGAGLVLDLHNAYTVCENLGIALDAWLARVDLARVVEIHLSGGSHSEPDWLASRRTYRLDAHDGAVPEPVWDAFAAVLPRCPALRAVIVEQVPDEVDAGRARALAADFARARALVRARPERPAAALPPATPEAAAVPSADVAELAALQRALVDACLADDPPGALAQAGALLPAGHGARRWLASVDPDGLRLTGLLIQKLRFERLCRGDRAVFEAFAREPEQLLQRWRAFAQENEAEVHPRAEARRFAAWSEAGPGTGAAFRHDPG